MFFLSLFILSTYAAANHVYFQGTELLSDVNYTQGFSVIPSCPLDPNRCATGPWYRIYNPFSTAPNTTASWQLVQWNSHSNLTTNGTMIDDGISKGIQWITDDKRFALFQDNRLQFSVNAYHEYNGTYRSPNAPWVHLLMQQNIGKTGGAVSLDQVSALEWNLDVQLLYMDQHIQPGYDPNYYAGQFLIYMTIQNLVEGDPEYGKYFWLGICLYDDRVLMSPLYVNGDKGTGSLIYSPAFSNFANLSVHSQHNVHVSGDMMPFVRLGLEAAVQRGFLNSTDLKKYYVGGMNIGWEVTGLNNGTMQIANLSLTQSTSQNPPSYEFNYDHNTQGWTILSNLYQSTNGPRNGQWILIPTGSDPQLLSPIMMIDTAIVKKIIIKMTNDALSDNQFQLYWSRDNEGMFNENESIWIEMVNDGEWREYVIDLTNNVNWHGIVRRLRIDPIRDGSGGNGFGIDYIRFAP